MQEQIAFGEIMSVLDQQTLLDFNVTETSLWQTCHSTWTHYPDFDPTSLFFYL